MKTLRDYKIQFMNASTIEECFTIFVEFLYDFGLKDVAKILIKKFRG